MSDSRLGRAVGPACATERARRDAADYTRAAEHADHGDAWPAACRGMDTEDFYPEGRPGQPLYDAQVRAAKAVCARCPGLAACREWALETGEPYGVWGGLDEDERRTVRRLLLTPIRLVPEPADEPADEPAAPAA